ncbi:N-glycosylase/DNA lyase [Candidatus Woesearchaeota archaeon]|nr:N-glycosylase/DNA lyase [Candidatus Woesearchaeota archaeon]
MDVNELMSEYNKKKEIINSRLNDFKNIKEEDWFYEMCFCILTPQSTARGADRAIKALKKLNFKNKTIDPIPYLLGEIRFQNNKGKYLIEAKAKFEEIENKIKNSKDSFELREWLVKNVKGYGYKESAHFLRNIGHKNLAILDRHILKNLFKSSVIKEVPKILTPKIYFEIEEKFKNFSEKIGISMDELDLLFWSMETGEVFK